MRALAGEDAMTREYNHGHRLAEADIADRPGGTVRPGALTCFFERDPGLALARRSTAEGMGTLLLMFAATGAGLQAHRLFPSEPGMGVVIGALTVAGGLAGLITALGAVSGGHFNPLITALQWLGRERGLGCSLAYVGAQA